METKKLKIKEIIKDFADVRTYVLEKPLDFTWDEGSCTHVGLEGFRPKNDGDKPNKELVHHYSIINTPEENKVSFTTRFFENPSVFKKELLNYSVGDEVTLFKTHSRMQLKRKNKKINLISMGIGIATYRSVILKYLENIKDIPNLTNLNISRNGDFLFREELDKYENEYYTNIWTQSREDFYSHLEEMTKNSDSYFYIVGSDLFILDVVKYLVENKISVNNLVLDKKLGWLEDNM